MSLASNSTQTLRLVSMLVGLLALPACIVVEGKQGPAGEDGIDGQDGEDGVDGQDGSDGADGADCVTGADTGAGEDAGGGDDTGTSDEPELDVNLLVNPGLETGDFTGWTLTYEGGDGWAVKNTGLDGTGFGTYAARTSYFWCEREQIVDLVAAGYSEAFLDTAPIINVSDWLRERYDVDEYAVAVALLDEDGGVIDSWGTSGSTSGSATWTDDTYVELSHSFSGYGAGVRYVLFTDGGQDTEFWGEQYGVEFDNAYVALSAAPR